MPRVLETSKRSAAAYRSGHFPVRKQRPFLVQAHMGASQRQVFICPCLHLFDQAVALLARRAETAAPQPASEVAWAPAGRQEPVLRAQPTQTWRAC